MRKEKTQHQIAKTNDRQTGLRCGKRVTSDMAGEVWFVPAPVSESVLPYRTVPISIGGSDS